MISIVITLIIFTIVMTLSEIYFGEIGPRLVCLILFVIILIIAYLNGR